MATIAAIFSPDYASAVVGSLTSGGSASGDIPLGKHRLFRIYAFDSTTPANTAIIRFSLYVKSVNGTVAPTSSSPFITCNAQSDTVFDTGDAYDTLNIIATDNSTDTIKYTILPLSKF